MANTYTDYREITAICTCGEKFKIASTYKKAPEMKLEVCGLCHPYYTGNQKLVDTERRIDRFYQRYAKSKDQSTSDKSEASS